MKAVGIFAGTFDPVHLGHVGFAIEAANKVGLDKVVMLPEPEPRGKRCVATHSQRLEMLRLATHGTDKLEIMALDTPQFTIVETLPVLQARLPGAKLHFLMGSDIFLRSLPLWPNLDDLLRGSDLIIGCRAGDGTELIHQKVRELGLVSSKVMVVATEYGHVAGGKVRQAGGSHEVAKEVLGFIADNNLYSLPVGRDR